MLSPRRLCTSYACPRAQQTGPLDSLPGMHGLRNSSCRMASTGACRGQLGAVREMGWALPRRVNLDDTDWPWLAPTVDVYGEESRVKNASSQHDQQRIAGMVVPVRLAAPWMHLTHLTLCSGCRVLCRDPPSRQHYGDIASLTVSVPLPTTRRHSNSSHCFDHNLDLSSFAPTLAQGPRHCNNVKMPVSLAMNPAHGDPCRTLFLFSTRFGYRILLLLLLPPWPYLCRLALVLACIHEAVCAAIYRAVSHVLACDTLGSHTPARGPWMLDYFGYSMIAAERGILVPCQLCTVFECGDFSRTWSIASLHSGYSISIRAHTFRAPAVWISLHHSTSSLPPDI